MRYCIPWLMAILIMQTGIAQTDSPAIERKSFITIHTGISVPILCYRSSNIDDKNAGYAKPGFTISVDYNYKFNHVGICGSVFYTSNSANKMVLRANGKNSYRYFGIMGGPIVTSKFGDKVEGDLRFLAGVAHVISPDLEYQGETILNGKHSTAFVWGGGAGMRYLLNDKTYLALRTDHVQSKPQFKNGDQSQKGEQHIVAMNFSAGLGWKF